MTQGNQVFAGPGTIKLKRSQDWGDMKLCFSLLHDLSKFGTWIPVYGGNNVLNPFEHQKIVQNPAFVDINFVKTSLVPQHWRRLHSKIRSKHKVCDKLYTSGKENVPNLY